MKDNYRFYKSFWDSFKLLKTDKEKIEFIEAINKIHFFEEHIDDISIKNDSVKLLFASIQHSLRSSINGYCDKMSIDYNSLFSRDNSDPCQGGIEGGMAGGSAQYIKGNKKEEINNKENIKRKIKLGNFERVRLTEQEIEKLKEIYVSYFEEAVNKLDNYIESKGDKYKSHYAVLCQGNWVYKEFASLIKEERNFKL